MIHIYCGDGKGKSTCAFGLTLRAVGRGMKAAVVQFLKGCDSGERIALAQLPGVTLVEVPETIKFVFAMDEEEKRTAAAECVWLLQEAARLADQETCTLVVLDECCAAISTGLLPLKAVTDFLDAHRAGVEIILTGRDPDPALLGRADYVTEMCKVKHPYDQGVQARIGIEW